MVTDYELLYELQKYGEKIARITDTNREICIKKLNHYKARQKLKENPSKQAKAIQMNKKYNSFESESNVTSSDHEEQFLTRQNKLLKSYLLNDNDDESVNQSGSEYVQMSNACTSPLSNSINNRMSSFNRHTYDDKNTNDKHNNDSDSDVILIDVKQASVSSDLDYLKRRLLSREKLEVEEKLQRHRNEINNILDRSRKQVCMSSDEIDNLRERLDSLKQHNKKQSTENWFKLFKQNSINWSLRLSKVLPYLLALFFVLILAQYLRMKIQANNLTLHDLFGMTNDENTKEIMYCTDLDDKRCQQTRNMARDLIDFLRVRTGQVECGYRRANEQHVSFEDVKSFFRKNSYLCENDLSSQQKGMLSVIMAILTHPTWHIRLLTHEMSETRLPNEVKYFHSSVATKSLSCRLNEALVYWSKQLFIYVLLLVTLLVSILIAMSIYKKCQAKKKSFYETIKQVVASVERQYEQNRLDSTIDSHVVISHMFDSLYEPAQRKSERVNWMSIVKFINENESRIREETKIINGEETQVWQWQVPKKLIPDNSPLHSYSSPSNLLTRPVINSNYNNQIIEYDDLLTQESAQPSLMSGCWQGEAIQKPTHLTFKSPTSCLKIRNMFDMDTIANNPFFCQKIRHEILSKCRGIDSILHLSCDEKSKEGTVYVKCNSNEAAGKVYQLLNAQWYEGRLLSVKFLRNDRYLERFPDSINYTRPLYL